MYPQQLQSLAACVSKLVGLAVACCTASPGSQVQVELLQQPHSPGLLSVKVAHNGLGLPKELVTIRKCLIPLRPSLRSPLLHLNALDIRTSDGEEPLLRLLRATATEEQLVVEEVGSEARPPSTQAQGTECTLTVRLDAVTPDDVFQCLELLLDQLRVLGPPVTVTWRINNVALRDGSGRTRPISGVKQVVQVADEPVQPLDQLYYGLEAEFSPPVPASDSDEGGSGSGGSSSSPPPAHGILPLQQPTAPTEAGWDGPDAATWVHGNQQQEQPPLQQQPVPMQVYIGVGEAGWGCEGAAEQFRGCRWVARAGLVLELPDRSSPAAAAAAAATLAATTGAAQQESQHDAGLPGSAAPQPAAASVPSTAATPVFVFRNYAVQLEQLHQVERGLLRCNWAGYGLQLPRGAVAPSAVPREGSLSLMVEFAQPKAGARLAAVVVHLQCCEPHSEVLSGKLPPLAASYESRMVKGALEAALEGLKQHPDCFGVLANRRQRSLLRSVPLISKSVAGIIHRAQNPAFTQQALSVLECGMSGIADRLEQLVTAALHGSSAHDAAEAAGAAGQEPGAEQNLPKRWRQGAEAY